MEELPKKEKGKNDYDYYSDLRDKNLLYIPEPKEEEEYLNYANRLFDHLIRYKYTGLYFLERSGNNYDYGNLNRSKRKDLILLLILVSFDKYNYMFNNGIDCVKKRQICEVVCNRLEE